MHTRTMAPQQIELPLLDAFHQSRSAATKSPSSSTGFRKVSSEPDDVCLYPSKKCTNPRAKKKNGEPHTMCEYHRIRANENQRRLERRRKAALRFPNRHAPRPTIWNRAFPEPIPIQGYRSGMLAGRTVFHLQQDLSSHWQPIEIEILIACLFDESTDSDESRRHTLVTGPPMPPMMGPFTAHTINLSQLV